MSNIKNLAELPAELIAHIFDLLKLPDKKSGRLTCQRIRWILDAPHWRLLRFKAIVVDPVAVKTLFNSCQYFEYARLMDLSEDLPSMTISRNPFPPIERLTIEAGNSGTNVLKILQYGCAFAKELKIEPLAFVNVGDCRIRRLAPQLKFEYLVELNLRVLRFHRRCLTFRSHDIMFLFEKTDIHNDDEHSKGVTTLMKFATMSNLKKFKLVFVAFEPIAVTMFPSIVDLIVGFYLFVERHAASLRNLELILYCGPKSIDSENFPANHCIQDYIPAHIQESISRNLRLESFKFSGEDRTLFLISPSVASDSLRTMYWSQFQGDSPRNHTKTLEDAILQNEDTLTTLEIIPGSGIFDMECLRNCKSLTHLTIEVSEIINGGVEVPSLKVLELILARSSSDSTHFDEIQWILRCFKNVEQISLSNESVVAPLSVDGLKALLTLPKWREIKYIATDDFLVYFNNVGPDPIQVYCSGVTGLTLETRVVPGKYYYCNLEGIIRRA